MKCQNPNGCSGDVTLYRRIRLCNVCYRFYQRNNEMRFGPGYSARAEYAHDARCKNCKMKRPYALGECRACYQYRRTHGRKRPRSLWMKAERCRNCKRPRDACGEFRRGVCNACRKYKERTGLNRPSYLWGAQAWCDCGNPATHMDVPLRFTTGTGHDEMALYNFCQDCYDLEFDA